MIDMQTIEKIANKLNAHNINYYNGKNGAGIIVDIDNECGHFKRLIQFSSEKELTEFLTLYDYSCYHNEVNLILDDYYRNLIPKSYKFIKNNQNYTYEMYKEEENLKTEQIQKGKQEEEKNKVDLQEYVNEKYGKLYVSFKESKQIYENLEKAEKILEQLKNNKKVDLTDVKSLIVNEGKPKFEDVRVGDYIYLETNLFNIQERISYKNWLNKLKMTLEQIDYLSHLSIFQRIFNKKGMQEKLDSISKSYKILNNDEYKKLVEEEKNYYDYLYKKLGTLSYDNIAIIKELDKIEDFSERIKLIDKYVLAKEEENKKQEQKIQEIKETRPYDKGYLVYKELSKQYEQNFTEQEKEALLIYNSAAFAIINLVGTIPDYEKMSLDEIKKIVNSDIYLERREIVKFALNKILEQSEYRESKLSILLNDFVKGDYIKKSVEILNIISNIKEKIFLPCDLTVYRAVSTKPNTKIEKISYGKLMSTTLNPNASLKYYGKGQHTLIKINLKAGTPVTAVFPKTVNYSLVYGYNLADDSKKTTPIYELLFNMDDYVVDYDNAHKDSIINFQLDQNGEFINSGIHNTYETSMQYKYELTLKNDENEIKSR